MIYYIRTIVLQSLKVLRTIPF